MGDGNGDRSGAHPIQDSLISTDNSISMKFIVVLLAVVLVSIVVVVALFFHK